LHQDNCVLFGTIGCINGSLLYAAHKANLTQVNAVYFWRDMHPGKRTDMKMTLSSGLLPLNVCRAKALLTVTTCEGAVTRPLERKKAALS
jgi:hypothetical protein